MDSNLKALKVIDLRAILSKASVPFPAKANKQDLIARIVASQQATQIYYQLHPDKYLSFFLSFCLVEQVVSSPDPPQPTPPPPPPLDTPKDEEAEKRRQRAARFGIPIVQPPKPGAKSLPDDSEKLKARASRFGISTVTEPIDAEEAERRRKRAERFGIVS
ncbi:hypothetical protein L208DRAFT_1425676 [Tricholoma matsutake]|nr:hypothetical protein L208DRAFT_1425676 [Tricholoma matsutake 945]